MDALTVSVVLLWPPCIALAVLLWALSRQVGVLFERVAPMGALITDAGPEVGTAAPAFQLHGIQSEPVLHRRARSARRRCCSSCRPAARCARS
jgi:methylamine dehydrogenase accessory protein MauD